MDDINKAPALADLNKAPYLDLARDPRIMYVKKSPALDDVNKTPALDGNKDAPGRPWRPLNAPDRAVNQTL